MWWLSTALAGTRYYGVPVEGIEGFGRAMFQSTITGWHVQVEDGIIRVYVAPDEEAAQAWMEKMRKRLVRLDPQPYPTAVPDTEPAVSQPADVPDVLEQQPAQAPVEETDPVDAPPPLPPIVFEEAFGEPAGLLLFRDGNLCILVHTKANAMRWAQVTQAAAVLEPTPPPEAPRLWLDEMGWWHLEAPEAVHIAYVGGTLLPDAGLTFTVPPRAGVAWGPLGRATRIDFDAQGQPISAP